MASSSRNYILARRGAGIADMTAVTPLNGDYTLDEAEKNGVYKINCTHQVGIATATEVGLSSDRFPIRIVMDTPSRKSGQVDTVVHYWQLTNAAGQHLPFQRKPLASDLAIRNLYTLITNFDQKCWAAWEAVRGIQYVTTQDDTLTAMEEELYAVLMLLNPTDAQKARVAEVVDAIFLTCAAAARVAYFKVSTDYYIRAKPHGAQIADMDGVVADRVALNEAALTMLFNYNRLKLRYDNLPDGTVATASYAIASMFRFGLFEAHESQEYITVFVRKAEGSATQFTITSVAPPAGVAAPADIAINQVIDISAVKLKKTLVEFGNLLVCISGVMHYLFNHTTGGTEMNGTLLTSLAMYKFVNIDTSRENIEEITSLFYEALHPANKRAIANIFFAKSRVTTHGRLRASARYERLQLDSYMNIRADPYPAGSHKAFICMTALRRVLQSGLGPFLPWAERLTDCINTCKDVLCNGARSHIGSSYYTGDPPIVQPASLDQYLPELAHYVHTFNKGDSLSMSPHLSIETSQRCNMNWKNLLKDLKAKDVSATTTEVVRSFLSTSGSVHFAFNPDDQSTWATATQTASVAMASINELFG